MTDHLSDDQFAECALSGGPEIADEVAAHLAGCEACRAEVAAFRESVESFNRTSLAWSEGQPARSLRPLVGSSQPQPAWAIASWATAACLLLAGAISFGTHRADLQPERNAAQPPVSAAAEDSPAQIERDNKLLMAVAEATSASAGSPLREYGLEAATPARAGAPQAQDEND